MTERLETGNTKDQNGDNNRSTCWTPFSLLRYKHLYNMYWDPSSSCSLSPFFFLLLPYGYLIDCVTGVASTQATTTTTVQGRTGGESNEELRPFIIDFRRTKNIASVSFPFFLVLANFFEEKKKSVNERGKEKDRVPSWYGQQTLDLECRPMEVHRQVFSISLFFVCAFVRTPSQSLYIYLLNSARKD